MCLGAHPAGRAVFGVEAGDHACCAFATDAEHRGAVARYAADAFARDERLAYVAHGTDETAVAALLDDAGLDAAARLRSGQLVLLSADETYLAGGRFEADRQAGLLAAMADEARADGFAVLAVAAEMSWALTEPGLVDELLSYEERVDEIFAAATLHAICLYDRRAFDPSAVTRARAAHGVSIDTAGDGSVVTRDGLVVQERDGGAVLALAGDCDAFGAPYLAGRLAEAIAHAPAVVVDASELAFADVATCRTLVHAAERLPEDRRLRIEGTPPGMRRVLSALDWLEHPRLEVA